MKHEVSIGISGFLLTVDCTCGVNVAKTLNRMTIPDIVEYYAKHIKETLGDGPGARLHVSSPETLVFHSEGEEKSGYEGVPENT